MSIKTNLPAFAVNRENLSSAKAGAEAVDCSDDFFAEVGNLVKEEAAIFIPDKYTERGKWMDGWECKMN